MGMVMIRCPQTGRAVSTGMEMDPSSFSHTPVFFGRTLCSVCKIDHEWFARDAWVGGQDVTKHALGKARPSA